MSERRPSVGDVVIYCDHKGKDRNALVQCVWGPDCINVLFLSDDAKMQDHWGRQSDHDSSVMHVSMAGAYGNYFRFPDEPRKEYSPPVDV